MPAETKIKDYPVVDCTLIGKRVREARKSSHMTQEELAEKCSCTPTHICNLENGKIGISLELLFRISSIFDKSMDYFVMDSPGANPQVKIDANIAPKLIQCDRDMLNIVDGRRNNIETPKVAKPDNEKTSLLERLKEKQQLLISDARKEDKEKKNERDLP